jgi:hypothetical protein
MFACCTRWQVVFSRVRSALVRNLWAYAYQIVPAQPLRRLGAIRALLKEATAAARGGARTWSGRLVLERRATHILIVSDAPGRDDSMDRRLAAEIERLDANFSVTEPLALAGHAEGVEWLATYDGNGR